MSSGHKNKLFNRKVIGVLIKDGFNCEVLPSNKNKVWIYKNKGEKYLVHSGALNKHHNLRRFLKNNYNYELKL